MLEILNNKLLGLKFMRYDRQGKSDPVFHIGKVTEKETVIIYFLTEDRNTKKQHFTHTYYHYTDVYKFLKIGEWVIKK